jgi:hypothetical protein
MRFHDEIPADRQPSLLPAVADEPSGGPDDATLEAHLARRQYGPFTLTDAVRPGWRLDVVPRAGYRHDAFVDPRTGGRLPALVAAVSSERLFDTFLALLEPLGDTLDVVVESSHDDHAIRRECRRESIERTVLESTLCEFEELLLDDGCTAVAVMHPEQQLEVQLDEHKLLVVYAHVRGPFERVLRRQGIGRDDRLRVISQAEHLHTSHTRFATIFDELAARLGADD